MNTVATKPNPIDREAELEATLRSVLRAFRNCDRSPDKRHPWIPGSDAPRVVSRIIATLDLCFPGRNNTGID